MQILQISCLSKLGCNRTQLNSGVFCLVVKRLVRNFISTRRKTKGLRSMKNRGMDILFAKPPICSHVRIWNMVLWTKRPGGVWLEHWNSEFTEIPIKRKIQNKKFRESVNILIESHTAGFLFVRICHEFWICLAKLDWDFKNPNPDFPIDRLLRVGPNPFSVPARRVKWKEERSVSHTFAFLTSHHISLGID